MANTHSAGEPLECYSLPITLHKEPAVDQQGTSVFDATGKQKYRCGFRIGGGIDQDNRKSPQGYPDKGIYVTYIYENGPAQGAGLQEHDKILQVNGYDLTTVTHDKAVDYIGRKPVLNMLVYRRGLPQFQQTGQPQPQFQAFHQPPSRYQQQQQSSQPQFQRY